MKRTYKQAAFIIPAHIQLAELQRQKLAQPAADMIKESLGLLFAYNPESFSDSVKNAVIKNVKDKMPGSLEAWIAGGWKG